MQRRPEAALRRRRAHVLFAAAAAVAGVGSSASAMVIVPIFQSGITGLSNAAQVETAINYVDTQFDSLYSNPITVTLTFQGTLAGTGTNAFLGETFPVLDNTSYLALRTAFLNNANTTGDADQLTAAADDWPKNDPTGSGSDWYVPDPEKQALGLLPAVDSTNGGTIEFDFSYNYSYDPYNRATSGTTDFLGVVEHEVAHALGRDAQQGGPDSLNKPSYSPLDLYRFTSSGNLALTNGNNVYYSINDGATNLKNFANSSDDSDWDNTGPDNSYVPDSFNAYSNGNQTNALTPVDITEMDDLGYNITSLTLNWNGGNSDFLTGNHWSSSSESNVNPFHGTSLVLNNGGTATHNFTSGEAVTLASNYDLGVSMQVSSGLLKLGVSGSASSGQADLLIDEDGSLTVSGSGNVNIGGALSVGDLSGVDDAQASFSGNSTVNIATVSGTDQSFYVGNNGTGTVSQFGNAVVNTPNLYIGTFGSSSGTYFLYDSATLTVTGQEDVGDHATGTFYHDDGKQTIDGNLFVGSFAAGNGYYFLSNSGELIVNGNELIGDDGTGTFTQSGATSHTDAGYLSIGTNSDGTGSYSLSGSGALSISGSEYVGDSGLGSFNQTGLSLNSICNNLYVGYSASANGSYTLSNGTVNVSYSEYIGNGGSGTFNQSGGFNNIPDNLLDLGDGSNGNGYYTLTGGTVTSSYEYVGNSGFGYFNQSGGLNSTDNLYVQHSSGNESLYGLSAGTLAVSGNEYVGYADAAFFGQSGGMNSVTGVFYVASGAHTTATYQLSGSGTLMASGGEEIGSGGAGIFNQSGGLNSLGVTGELDVGVSSSGTYDLSGGVLDGPSFGFEYIGDANTGTFVQTGGTHNADDLRIGYNGSTGFYTLSNTGVLSASSESVGTSGNGTFLQTGGTNSVGELNIAENSGSNGTYTLTGGTLAAGSVYVGGDFILTGGVGTLNVSGGVMNVSGTLAVYSGAANSINLTAGTINTAALDTNGVPGNLFWTGGVLGLTAGVVFDPGAASTSTSAAFGSSLTLGIGQTLNVTGNEVLGGTDAFSLEIGDYGLGGGNPTNNVSGNFYIGAGSTCSLIPVGGSTPVLSVSGKEFIGNGGTGTFVQEGGTNTVGSNGLEVGSNIGDLGIYSLSAVSFPIENAFLNSSGNEVIGSRGTGIFNQTGGTNTFSSGFLYLGLHPNGQGTYTLSGSNSYLLAEGSEYIGEQGTGVFTQSGGTNHVDNFFGVGDQNGSNGTYNLSGGTFSGGIFEYIGIDGNGAFNQSGGTNNATTMEVGENGDSTGTYTLSKGTVNAEDEDIGLSGPGSFTQSGGLNNMADGDFSAVILGENAGATGTYNLSSKGTLTVGGFNTFEYIGYSGAGLFNQSGGLNTNGNAMYIAYAGGSTGGYSLSGGVVNTPAIYVGGSASSAGGTGTFTISDTGQLNDSGTLTVYKNGTVNVNGGGATAGALTIASGGVVNVNATLSIQYASPATDPINTIIGYLKSGFAGGAWTGNGINSSLAAANHSGTPIDSVGYADSAADGADSSPIPGLGNASANNIIVRYTEAGDANMDGRVNFTDYSILIANFGKTGTDWAHGNFLYGPGTNFGDYSKVIANFGLALSPPGGSAVTDGGDTVIGLAGSSRAIPEVPGVPEPSAIFITAAGAAGLLSRRRKRHI